MENSKLKVGLLGATGRMGKLICQTINSDKKLNFFIHLGHSRTQKNLMINEEININLTKNLDEVFKSCDVIVDFSHAQVIDDVLNLNVIYLKPLIICSTGWEKTDERNDKIKQIANIAPILISTNTSLGSNLQSLICEMMAKILPSEYQIDLIEKHHDQKIDIPSGTACTLIEAIKNGKKGKQIAQHLTQEKLNHGQLTHGPRPQNFISVSAIRSGNLPGEHEVSFTSNMELISIKHIAYNRQLFASGLVKIIEFLTQKNLPPKNYNMKDVLQNYF